MLQKIRDLLCSFVIRSASGFNDKDVWLQQSVSQDHKKAIIASPQSSQMKVAVVGEKGFLLEERKASICAEGRNEFNSP